MFQARLQGINIEHVKPILEKKEQVEHIDIVENILKSFNLMVDRVNDMNGNILTLSQKIDNGNDNVSLATTVKADPLQSFFSADIEKKNLECIKKIKDDVEYIREESKKSSQNTKQCSTTMNDIFDKIIEIEKQIDVLTKCPPKEDPPKKISTKVPTRKKDYGL